MQGLRLVRGALPEEAALPKRRITGTRALLYGKAARQDGTPLGIRAFRRGADRVGSSYYPRWGKHSFTCRLFVAQHAGYSVGYDISGAKILDQVAQACFRFLRSNGNRFASMKTVETVLNVPRSSASFIRFWFGRRKGFPEVEQLVRIADHGASRLTVSLTTRRPSRIRTTAV